MKIQYSVSTMEKINQKVCEDLVDGKIVGWFQDCGEFGPRALGFRSILADPRNPKIKDYLNEKVKYREWWRPYAPIILEEDLGDYFETTYQSDYMLFSAKVRNKDIKGVIHKDNTARYQTINRKINPKMYDLLKHFKKITSCSVLLNTSFNLGGEPIVETPKDAFQTFKKSNIDVLVMEEVYLTKTQNKKEK